MTFLFSRIVKHIMKYFITGYIVAFEMINGRLFDGIELLFQFLANLLGHYEFKFSL